MMQIGLLWYEKDPKIPFAQKVLEAAGCYEERFGVAPNTCYVHPSMAADGVTVPGIELRRWAAIRPHHFWVGMAEDAQPAPVPEPVAAPEPLEAPPSAPASRRKKRAA